MLFVVAMVVSLGLGLLRGGRLEALAKLEFRRLWLLMVGAFLWLMTGPLPLQLWLHITGIAPYLLLLAHTLLLVFIWHNRRVYWLPLIGLGLLSNLVVMAANGGQMPVDGTLLQVLGMQDITALRVQRGIWMYYREIEPGMRLVFLGDVIYLGPPFPWPRAMSVGDVLIACGAFLVVQKLLMQPARRIGLHQDTV